MIAHVLTTLFFPLPPSPASPHVATQFRGYCSIGTLGDGIPQFAITIPKV